MTNSRRLHFFLSFFLLNIIGAFSTHVALGEEANDSPITDKVSSFVSDLMNQNSLPGKFISDGSEVEVKKLGIKISPPSGWEVVTDSPNISLIIQEPEPEQVVYDKAIFRRNITVAAVHKPAPIDEQRAARLKDELLNSFGKEGVQNFEVIEHKFFNYKSKDDGLLAYTSFNIGEFQMMQMHVLLSGDSKQFLLTYTDLADRFSDTKYFDQAWNTMAGMTVSGQPPRRYLKEALILGVAIGMLILLLLLKVVRRRKETSGYLDDADLVYQDDHDWDINSGLKEDTSSLAITQTGVWRLSSSARTINDF